MCCKIYALIYIYVSYLMLWCRIKKLNSELWEHFCHFSVSVGAPVMVERKPCDRKSTGVGSAGGAVESTFVDSRRDEPAGGGDP